MLVARELAGDDLGDRRVHGVRDLVDRLPEESVDVILGARLDPEGLERRPDEYPMREPPEGRGRSPAPGLSVYAGTWKGPFGPTAIAPG